MPSYEAVCEEKGLQYLVPIIDVATRWNSTYDMLVRALDLKSILTETIVRHTDKHLKQVILDDDDWVSFIASLY